MPADLQALLLKDNFDNHTKEWKSYIQSKSYKGSLDWYLDCDAYRSLVELGHPILPHIRDEIRKEIKGPRRNKKIKNPDYLWGYLISTIVGPAFYLGLIKSQGLTPEELMDYSLKWLNHNADLYSSDNIIK